MTWGVLSGGAVYLSSDKGGKWRVLPNTGECGPIYDFVLRADGEVLIGTVNGLCFSSDFGNHWTSPSQGFHPGTVTSVLWHPHQRQIMFAVQNGVPWASIDGGASWESMESANFRGEAISEIYWGSDYSKLYAVGFARGVFVRSVLPVAGLALRSAALP